VLGEFGESMIDKDKLREALDRVYGEIEPFLSQFQNSGSELETHLADICHCAESAINELDEFEESA
jgi:hypothetical protein